MPRNPDDFTDAENEAHLKSLDPKGLAEVIEAQINIVERIGRSMPLDWSRDQVKDYLSERFAGEWWDWNDDEMFDAAVDVALEARDRPQ